MRRVQLTPLTEGSSGMKIHIIDPDCKRCDGTGRIANTDEGEPWSDWASLPPGSDLAVQLGHVKPIPCPVCQSEPA